MKKKLLLSHEIGTVTHSKEEPAQVLDSGTGAPPATLGTRTPHWGHGLKRGADISAVDSACDKLGGYHGMVCVGYCKYPIKHISDSNIEINTYIHSHSHVHYIYHMICTQNPLEEPLLF